MDSSSNTTNNTYMLRPLRLVVRTLGFHPSNSSSILLGATNGVVSQLGDFTRALGKLVRVLYNPI